MEFNLAQDFLAGLDRLSAAFGWADFPRLKYLTLGSTAVRLQTLRRPTRQHIDPASALLQRQHLSLIGLDDGLTCKVCGRSDVLHPSSAAWHIGARQSPGGPHRPGAQ